MLPTRLLPAQIHVETSMAELSRQMIDTRDASLEVFAMGSGTVLALCLHGFPEHAVSWRNQMAPLARLGMTVWAPNLRGYGTSSSPREVQSYRLGRLVDDVRDLIVASGCTRAVVIGHDWGATIGWFAALERVPGMNALVVLNSYWPGRWPELARGEQAVRSSYLGLLLSAAPELFNAAMDRSGLNRAMDALLARSGRCPEAVLAVYRWNLSRPGGLTAMLNYYRANLDPLQVEPGMLELLKSGVDMPTLQINGAADPFIAPGLTGGSADVLPDIETHVLPGVTHWAPQEAPRIVNGLIGDWLSRRVLLTEPDRRRA